MAKINYSASPLKHGFSLIEAAIVLGVIGLVIGGLWVAAEQVNLTRTSNQTLNGIMKIGHDLQNIITINAVYPTVTQATLSHKLVEAYAAALPDFTLTPTPRNYANPVAISPIGNMTGYLSNLYIVNNSNYTNDAYGVRITSVPQAICLRMAAKLHAIMAADTNGDFIYAAVFSKRNGTNFWNYAFDGLYLSVNPALAIWSGYTNGRWDSNVCSTSDSMIQIDIKARAN